MFVELETAKKICSETAVEAWEKVQNSLTENGKTRLGKMPAIYWRKFGFRTAGRYTWNRCGTLTNDYIEMNINFLNSPSANEFILATIKHELAHCVTQRLTNICHHNSEFRRVAMIMGDDGETHHNYEAPINSKNTTYTCTCGAKFTLSPLKIKRAKFGYYICRNCHTNLSNIVK